VHYVAGNDGYFVKLRATDTQDLGRIVREEILTLEGVLETRTTVVLTTYKETARIPLGRKIFTGDGNR